MIYATLDKNNICIGISSLAGEVNRDNLILLPHYDSSVMGKKYEGCEWVEVEREAVVVEPTEQEIFQAEVLLTQAEILTKAQEHDEVLAEILLNSLGV